MRLHTYWRSSAAYRVRIALNLKGLDYEPVPHHLARGEHLTSDYLALNPQALVPALEVDGAVLAQSLSIIEYLDERHPEPPLLPGTAIERARVRAMAQAIACDIHPLNNLRVLQYLRAETGCGEEQVTAWVRHWVAQGFAGLERLVHGERYCHGDRVSLADVCLVPQMYNARRFQCDLSPYPRLVAIDGHLTTLEPFDRARPEKQSDAA